MSLVLACVLVTKQLTGDGVISHITVNRLADRLRVVIEEAVAAAMRVAN